MTHCKIVFADDVIVSIILLKGDDFNRDWWDIACTDCLEVWSAL